MNGIQFLLLAFSLTLVEVINALLVDVSIGYNNSEKGMKRAARGGTAYNI